MQARDRCCVVSFDAMDRELALSLVACGRMPVFGEALRGGTAVPFGSPAAVFVGATWPTIWTGLGTGYHGRAGPEVLVPGSYDVVRWLPEYTGGTPLWRQAASAGYRYVIVDVPHSIVGSDPHGTEVVDWGSHDRERGRFSTWPRLLADEIVERFGRHPVESCDVVARVGGPAVLEDALVEGMDRRVKLSTALLTEREWDLAWIVFGESHCAGHHLWPVELDTDPVGPAALLRVYEALDRALGELRAALRPEDRLVVLLSHGIGPHHDGTHLLGDVLSRLDDAWDRAGALRRAAEGGRRVLRRAWSRPPHWVRTLDGSRSFYRAPNSAPYGAVRVNLRGREPRGRVAPGAQYEACCDWLTDELLALRNSNGPMPAARRVLRASELYEGPALAWLPDLFVEWETRVPIEVLESSTVGRVTGRYGGPRTGDHRPGGLLVVPGPDGLSPEEPPSDADATVVARTIAAQLGLDLASAAPATQRFPVMN